MCGIVGYTGPRNATPILLDALRRLEYRGYDSAGIVVLENGSFASHKSTGKIQELEARVAQRPPAGSLGLGHTRWATHGGVTEPNAHPHFSCDRRIALVHNGIVENHEELRQELTSKGHEFRSETDTEVIVHLLEEYYSSARKRGLLKSVAQVVKRLEGAFALGIVVADCPDLFMAVRHQSPLVIGLGENENYMASDISALLPFTRRVLYLQEDEIAEIGRGGVRIYGPDLSVRKHSSSKIDWSPAAAEKGGYPHYMLKEIHEQPQTVAAELAGRVDVRQGSVVFENLGLSTNYLKSIHRIAIAACGTAWHAGLVTKVALEDLARLPVDVGYASELRYGDYPFDRRTLVLAVSQSGETLDTLMAARMAREQGSKVLAITNVRGSSLDREADGVVPMRAGLEIGVAATKTYTSQLLLGVLLATYLGRLRSVLPRKRAVDLLRSAQTLPRKLERILADPSVIRVCARKFMRDYDFMYIGRRYNLATALEGALKMKEISYLHAEGYGAGEMKHGPLALVDPGLTTVAVAVQGRVYDKMVSNIQEIRARKGPVIALATEGDGAIEPLANHVFRVPPIDEVLSPVLAVVPLQLLAYYTAVGLGRDVDQPRNLAKSVTVE